MIASRAYLQQLIPWFSKTEGNTYATIAASPFPLQGKTNACSKGSKKDFWRCYRGGLRSSQDIPSTHHKLISLALHYLPFASHFRLPHFTLAISFALSFSFAFLSPWLSPKELRVLSRVIVLWIVPLSSLSS